MKVKHTLIAFHLEVAMSLRNDVLKARILNNIRFIRGIAVNTYRNDAGGRLPPSAELVLIYHKAERDGEIERHAEIRMYGHVVGSLSGKPFDKAVDEIYADLAALSGVYLQRLRDPFDGRIELSLHTPSLRVYTHTDHVVRRFPFSDDWADDAPGDAVIPSPAERREYVGGVLT